MPEKLTQEDVVMFLREALIFYAIVRRVRPLSFAEHVQESLESFPVCTATEKYEGTARKLQEIPKPKGEVRVMLDNHAHIISKDPQVTVAHIVVETAALIGDRFVLSEAMRHHDKTVQERARELALLLEKR